MSFSVPRSSVLSLVCLIGCSTVLYSSPADAQNSISAERFLAISEAALQEPSSDAKLGAEYRDVSFEDSDEVIFATDDPVTQAGFESASVLPERLIQDSHIRLAQNSSRNDRSTNSRSPTRSRRSSRTPYMIGDSPGTVGGNGFSFQGVDIASVNSPYFNSNRFNASEAGTFMPTDRFIFSYRHLNNANSTDVLGNFDNVDIERFVVGMEKTALGGMASAQIRVPLLYQLDSDLSFDDIGAGHTTGGSGGQLGNMSVNFKALLTNRSKFALAAGLAVNIPTGGDARISQDYIAPITINQAAGIGGTANLVSRSDFDNDAVNLIPYLAWVLRPTDRFFQQGFFQIDAPLNSSDASIDVDGTIIPDSDYDPESVTNYVSGKIKQQTLLRVNLGFGYWLQQGSRKGKPTGLAALFEVHYTGSLDHGRSLNSPLATLVDSGGTLPDIPVSATAGGGGRFNSVNLSSGLALDLGSCVLTNGVIVPVTNDRMFDFEYNLQVNRRF